MNKWQTYKIKDLTQSFSGGTPLTDRPEFYQNGDIPFITSSDLNQQFIDSVPHYITKQGLESSSAKIVEPQTLLLALYGATAGTAAITHIRGAINQAILAFSKSKIDIKFLYYLLSEKKPYILHTYTQGGQPNLSAQIVNNLSIYVPTDCHEQQKIVEVLETWDKAIQLTRKLIEQKELQKKYLMLQLLTGRTRLKGFTEKWLKLSLSDILKERNTYQTKGAEFPHLSLTKEGVAPKTARYNRDFLVKDENKSYKITLLDDICYNPANLKFGVICRNKYGAGIFSPIYVTYEIKKYDKSFVEKLLLLPTTIALARRYEEGTVYERMAVSSEDFLKLKLDFPPTEEESIEVGKVLMNSDKEIDLLRQKLAKLEEQKKGLMQVLLTGKVRLAVKETK